MSALSTGFDRTTGDIAERTAQTISDQEEVLAGSKFNTIITLYLLKSASSKVKPPEFVFFVNPIV